MTLKVLEQRFAVCKMANLAQVNFNSEFLFIGKTDEEVSVVCEENSIPQNSEVCENGWRGFRIEGVLDFSLTGILSKISAVLADEEIGIFAISTYNTDYILVKEENLKKATQALENKGYNIKNF
ncbi:MAG: ACT domain-containing protein [Anaerotignaceae bacterium]